MDHGCAVGQIALKPLHCMARHPKIQAITFDAGGTLLETWPSVGAVYAAVAAEHGWPDLSVAQLNENFLAAWRAKTEFDYSEDAWRRIVEESFAGLVDAPALRGFFEAIYARFEKPESWRVYDDVRPALESLRRRGVRLAVVSNWDARLVPLLERLGLTAYFDAVLISAEVGFAKPSPEIFAAAVARLGAVPGAVLHVGDNAREDVAGARGAGLAAVRIDRRQVLEEAEVFPRLTCLDSWF